LRTEVRHPTAKVETAGKRGAAQDRNQDESTHRAAAFFRRLA
jgi:hypothetical protein